MTWKDFSRKAITVPFVPKGRDYAGWDCWGLCVCGYRDVLGIELPDYRDSYETVIDPRALHKLFTFGRDAQWREIDPRVGAVALIALRRLPVHVGIVVSRTHILHCCRGMGTVREPARSLKIHAFGEPAWIATS